MVDGDDVLVTAILEQSAIIGPAPKVGMVTVILEQHVRNRPKFHPIGMSFREQDLANAEFSFEMPAEGETVEVTTFDYMDICTTLAGYIDPDANAIRAVVGVQVTNSSDQRKAGQIHTGRCISFPNPCRL